MATHNSFANVNEAKNKAHTDKGVGRNLSRALDITLGP